MKANGNRPDDRVELADEQDMKSFRPFLATVLAFSALGPMLGLLALCSWLWSVVLIGAIFGGPSQPSMDTMATIVGLLLALPVGGLPLAYLFGFLPAFMTGLVFAALVLWLPALGRMPRRWRSGLAAFVAAAVCSCWYAWRHGLGFSDAVAFTCIGAVAACVIGYFWPRTRALDERIAET